MSDVRFVGLVYYRSKLIVTENPGACRVGTDTEQC